MNPQSQNLSDYLQNTSIIDWETPDIIEQTKALTQNLSSDVEKAKALFEWVRDVIPHSRDIDSDIVTCSASEVLKHRTGICYAKSHLLAAMFRCTGIAAGFCYQAFRRNPPYHGLALHGLNGLYLASLSRWIRVDPRGNTGAINAQFSLTEEILAFPVDLEQGEFMYQTIYPDPAPSVVTTLRGFSSLRTLWAYLPKPFEEKSVGRQDVQVTASSHA